jgi:5-(carboxyamino)imidazole ribonucleotide synthase
MKQTQFSSDFRLGILGGGQLGKMMLYTTRKWDIATYVMDKNDAAPAFQGCDVFFEGDIMNYEAVMEFGEQVDVLTVEIENVNIEALQELEDKGIAVSPSAKVLNTIKNKARQKTFYKNNGIATAAFEMYDQPNLNHNRSYPFVWKSAEGGYDGNGVKIIRKASDLENLPMIACIYEDMVPFDLELAVIVARNAKGEMKTYPVVEMEFHPEANQVEYVICPARINMDISNRAQQLALQVSKAYEHVGLLAVELFLTKSGELLVNEVAPRPHNSGHYSIEGAITDQFEQHIRCVCNLPLGATDSTVASVMVNLVGEEGNEGKVVYEGIEDILSLPGVTPHIYGKKQTRPFRKMGHVTVVANNVIKARKLAEVVKNSIRVIAAE